MEENNRLNSLKDTFVYSNDEEQLFWDAFCWSVKGLLNAAALFYEGYNLIAIVMSDSDSIYVFNDYVAGSEETKAIDHCFSSPETNPKLFFEYIKILREKQIKFHAPVNNSAK